MIKPRRCRGKPNHGGVLREPEAVSNKPKKNCSFPEALPEGFTTKSKWGGPGMPGGEGGGYVTLVTPGGASCTGLGGGEGRCERRGLRVSAGYPTRSSQHWTRGGSLSLVLFFSPPPLLPWLC